MAGDLNDPWHPFPGNRTPAEFGLAHFHYSGGVKVFGALLGNDVLVPAVVFQFAQPDGSGFYPPIALVAAPDELRALATLVDQATASALIAASGGR
jgi:hypothetical protein